MRHLKLYQFKIIISISLVVIGMIVLGFLAYKYWAPFRNTIRNSKIILPGAKQVDRDDSGGNGFKIPSQLITTQVARFPLEIKSKDIDSISAYIKFKKGPREIKLGVSGNEKDKFVYKPIYNIRVQEAKNWVKTEGTNNILFQKNKKYNTIFDLINQPPEKERIAGYFIDYIALAKNKPTKVDDKNVINTTLLRGSHILYVRVDKPPLKIKVSKQDMNMYEGEDKLKIFIYLGEKKIAEKEIPDDGLSGKNLLKKDVQSESLELKDNETGIYKIELFNDSKGSDSVINRIEVNQAKVVFKNLYILDNNPSTVYTDSFDLNSLIIHKDYLHNLKIDDDYEILITESAKPVTTNLRSLASRDSQDEHLFKIYSEKNDIAYSGDGYFAFSTDQYFNPNLIKYTELQALENLNNIDYILTTLEPAREEGDWLVSEVSFDPEQLNISDNKLYFSLEAPDLPNYGGKLEIESFEVEVNSPGLLSKKSDEGKKRVPDVNEVEKEEKGVKVVIGNVTDKISNTIGRAKGFFTDVINKVFKREKAEEKTSTSKSSPTITPTSANKPTSSPTPTVYLGKSIKIRVLNAGAPAGYATKYSDQLKNSGFTNVESANADNEEITGVSISHPSIKTEDIKAIENIFSSEYKSINISVNNSSADIVIKIGKL